jgi:hypothetical protein
MIIPHGVGSDYCTLWLGAFHCDRRPEGVELHISPLVRQYRFLPSSGTLSIRLICSQVRDRSIIAKLWSIAALRPTARIRSI